MPKEKYYMRKIFGVLLSVLCICCAAIGLTGCKKDKHIHAFDKQVITDEYRATDATCTEAATYYYSCSCGEKGTETFTSGNALGHEYENPSYIWGENYSECIAMTVCLRDSTHTVMEIAVPSSKITQNKSCLLNEETTYSAKFQNPLFGEQTKVIVTDKKTGHTYSDKWESDETNHWHNAVCEHTEETTIKENHSASDWIIDVEATYEHAGQKHKECIVCKKVLEIKEVAKLVKDEINFNTLVIGKDNSAYAKLTNEITTYNFAEEITTRGNATYVVSLDSYGIQQSLTKVVPLTEGNNTFYIFATIGDKIETYTITLRRRPIYTVSFYISDGMAGDKQYIEEDLFATEPQAPGDVKAGYTFLGWNYDFSKAITDNLDVNAVWNPNTDTAYKVEYFLQNLENNNYTLHESFDMQGTTDTTVEAEKKTYEHFTLNTNSGLLNGKIDGDGSLVLRLYYTRNTYAVKIRNNDSSAGTIEGTFDGYLKYGKELTISAIPTIGHYFTGWYQWGTLFFDESEYTFIVETDLNITANWCLDERLSNLDFILTEKDCVIMGVKDKTITSIEIPEYVTRIARSAFIECNNLTTVIWNAENCTDVGSEDYTSMTLYAAFPYLSLTNVIIGDNVKNIPNFAFIDCSRLTSITIPDSVTSIGNGAFYNCSGLTNITIPDSVTSIGYDAFYGCSGLTSIIIPDSVTSIGYDAFYDCSGLTSIYYTGDVAGWCGIEGLGNVTSSSRALYIGDKKVEGDLVIPNSVTSIGNGAFRGCNSLESITLPFIGASRTANSGYNQVFGYIFGYTTTSSDSSVSGATYQGQYDGIYYHYYIPASLKTVILSESMTSIGKYAFRNCNGLTSVIIPNSVTSIGNYAFSGCSGLTSVTYLGTIDQWAEISFGDSSNPLYYAHNLYINDELVTEVNLTTATKISAYAFGGCSGLTSVTIGNSVTSIGSYAFMGCDNLKYNEYDNGYYLGNSNNPYVALIRAKNTSISSCIINENTKIICPNAFNSCSGLISVTIPDSMTSIGERAFYNCSGLTSVTIGNSVTSIGYGAFYNCSGLTSITIPDSVTSIGSYAFRGCSGLTSVTIGGSVTSIGYQAFDGCSGLNNITYTGTIADWKNINKGSYWNNSVPTTCLIHCTDGDIKISD